MILSLILAAGVLVTLLIVFVLIKIYYYFNPTRTVESIIDNAELKERVAEAGNSGHSGADGVLNSFAINGLGGTEGDFPEPGESGKTYEGRGTKGNSGSVGNQGPNGSYGGTGLKGIPSNAVIPFISEKSGPQIEKLPVTIEHEFSYEGVVHKLTGSFLFDDINYFSFENGEGNTKYKIKTDAGSGFSALTLPVGQNGSGRKVYAKIRILLEKKDSDSDGTVFYVSPPINRNGYIMESTTNHNDTITGENKLTEVTISNQRDFGLDFDIVETSDIYYNFMVGGVLRYRAIFNIEPPISDIVPRIEERLSNKEITEFAIHSKDLTAKGNVIKNKVFDSMTSNTLIDLISPRLAQGFVVYKNSEDSKNLWTVESNKRLNDSILTETPKIITSFDNLEKDTNQTKDGISKIKYVKVFGKYTPPSGDFSNQPFTNNTYQNLIFSIRKKGNTVLTSAQYNFNTKLNEYNRFFVSVMEIYELWQESVELHGASSPQAMALNNSYIISENELKMAKNDLNSALIDLRDAEIADSNIVSNSSTSSEHFSTRMTIDDLFIGYSNEPSTLTYPSSLTNSKLYLKFIAKIKMTDFTNYKYDVFVNNNYASVVTVDNNEVLNLETRYPWGHQVGPDAFLPIIYREGFIYYPIEIKTDQNILFEKVFGKRILLKISTSKLSFAAHFGKPDNFDDPSPTPGPNDTVTRINGQTITNTAFEGDNTSYNFEPGTDVIEGFDFRFDAEKYDVERGTFLAGYIKPGEDTPIFQKIIGYRDTNGDYYLTIPPNNY